MVKILAKTDGVPVDDTSSSSMKRQQANPISVNGRVFGTVGVGTVAAADVLEIGATVVAGAGVGGAAVVVGARVAGIPVVGVAAVVAVTMITLL
jgi:hypothetical protein